MKQYDANYCLVTNNCRNFVDDVLEKCGMHKFFKDKNKIKIFTAIIFLLFGCNLSSDRSNIRPENIKQIKIYDIDPKKSVNSTIGSLSGVSHVTLTKQQSKSLFSAVEEGGNRIWKGAFLAVVECDGGVQYHLAISYYDCFFKVLETGEMFKFVKESQDECQQIIKNALHQVFIPSRKAGLTPPTIACAF